MAGAVGAVLSILPLGFLLGLPLAGFLSVLFYRRRTWGAEPSPGAGFSLGVLTGVFAFGMFVVLMAIDAIVSHTGDQISRQMIEAVHRAQARSPDPQSRQMMDYFLTPQGMAVLMVLGLIVVCIVFVLLGGIGGAVSAGLLRRKDPDK